MLLFFVLWLLLLLWILTQPHVFLSQEIRRTPRTQPSSQASSCPHCCYWGCGAPESACPMSCSLQSWVLMFSYLRLIGCIWRWCRTLFVMRISLEPYNDVSRNHMAVRSRGAPDWWRDHTFMGWLGAGRRKTVLKRVADWSVSPFVCGTSIFVTSLAVTLECCVYLNCLLRLLHDVPISVIIQQVAQAASEIL